MLGLRYRIIFSERVGINERVKMRIPASSFACLWISVGASRAEWATRKKGKERREGRKKERKERTVGERRRRGKVGEERV